MFAGGANHLQASGNGPTVVELGARSLAPGLVLSARACELDRDLPFGIVRQLLAPEALDFSGAAALAGPGCSAR